MCMCVYGSRQAEQTELTSRPMLLCLLAQLASQMRDDMVLAAPRDSAPDALPLPILNLGLPKSASETMYARLMRTKPGRSASHLPADRERD